MLLTTNHSLIGIRGRHHHYIRHLLLLRRLLLGLRSIQELRVGSGFSLGLKVWVGLGHKLGKILGLLWVKALVTLRFSGWVGSGFFGFFANST